MVRVYGKKSSRYRRRKLLACALLFLVLSAVGIAVYFFASGTAAPTVTPDKYKQFFTSAAAFYTEKGKPVNNPVAESAPVDESWFSDAVFIGDSRTEGFAYYTGIPNITAYTSRGLTAGKALKDPIVRVEGTLITVPEALSRRPDIKKIYIGFGLNELGYRHPEVFIEEYGSLIDEVRRIDPTAQIYIQAILPVTKSRSDTSEVWNNDRIRMYNDNIIALTKEKGVIYLDVYSAFIDENGALPEDAATDGIHLTKPYCKVWLQYLLTHAVPLEQ